MLNRKQLEKALFLSYPTEVTQETQNRRMTNIEAIKRVVSNAQDEENLAHGRKEERLILYSTKSGESITIQYPGKEAKNPDNDKYNKYDFRPRIILPDETEVRDLTFNDLWNIFLSIDKDYHLLTKPIAALFFRMGRMIDYNKVEEEYECKIVDIASGNMTPNGYKTLEWYKYLPDKDVIEALNHEFFSIPIGDNMYISFEAYILFFSLLVENEDIKYYYRKQNLTSGRISTCDSVLLLALYFSGDISLPYLIQKFVSGNGVGKCQSSEIGQATSNIIRIVNQKQEIVDLLTQNNILYKENSSITIKGERISVSIKIPTYSIAILTQSDTNKEAALASKNWIVFDIETTIFDETKYKSLLEYLGLLSS